MQPNDLDDCHSCFPACIFIYLIAVSSLSLDKPLDLNQKTYHRLKLALSLNLRRQIFIAVCDDLVLRDRLASQLQSELNNHPGAGSSSASGASDPSGRAALYPRLVNLSLNTSDPNPIAEMGRWLTQYPAPRHRHGGYAPTPAFQILGVEHLTRQQAAVQRLFLTHLQEIERSLPSLDSSLLIWMPRPWFHSIPQSASAFWRCRTGVFEFIGEPTPIPTPPESIPGLERRSLPPAPTQTNQAAQAASPGPAIPANTSSVSPDLWSILTNDLAKLDADSSDEATPTAPPATPAASESPAAAPPPTPTTSQEQAIPADLEDSAADTSWIDADPPAASLADQAAVDSGTSTDLAQELAQEVAQTNGLEAPADTQHLPATSTILDVATGVLTGQLEPIALLEQIELLHQQQAPAAVLANAYRTLGNVYRDRIEQGDGAPQTLMVGIHAYEQTLHWLQDDSPLWTDVLNDLGNLYWMLSQTIANAAERLPYLQQGVQAYQLALTKINVQSQPQSYAMIQNNLGAAYSDLARYQNSAENLEMSVQAYQQALRYRNPEEEPLRYASTQNNLGTAYWNLAQYNQPVEHLKQSILAYGEALRYYNPSQDPLNYAMIQSNLGTAYWNLAQHERPQDWLMLALGAYRLALRYRTAETTPAAFSATQNNLGTAYWQMASYATGDAAARLDYLTEAIAAYNAAIQAAQSLTTGPHPVPLNFDLNATHNNLGLAHFQLASDHQITVGSAVRSVHLESSFDHHLQAWEGWQHKPDFRQAALGGIVQAIRNLYEISGIPGQNRILAKVPPHLLPELLPKL